MRNSSTTLFCKWVGSIEVGTFKKDNVIHYQADKDSEVSVVEALGGVEFSPETKHS